MKKKILAALLATALVAGLAACGKTEETGTSSAGSSSASSSSDGTEGSSSASSEDEEKAIYEKLYDPCLDLPLIEGDYEIADCLTLGDYKKLPLARTKAQITDEEIDNEINYNLPVQEVTDPNATVQEGDTIKLDYAGTKDGVAFEGGTAEDADLVIGSNSFIEGFETGMIGMWVGEERDLYLTFPENYWSEELAGADVVFHVKVKSISRAAELTDEWVAEFTQGECHTIDEYREKIRKQLTEERQESIDGELKQEIWAAVKEATTFKGLPKDLVEKGELNFRSYHESTAEGYGMTMEEYLEGSEVSQYEFDLMAEVSSRMYAQEWMLSRALAEAEGITADSDLYKEKVEEFKGFYNMSEEEIAEQIGEETLENYAITNAVLEKLMTYIPNEE